MVVYFAFNVGECATRKYTLRCDNGANFNSGEDDETYTIFRWSAYRSANDTVLRYRYRYRTSDWMIRHGMKPKVHKNYYGNPAEMPEYQNFMYENMAAPPAKRKRFGDDKDDIV